MRNSRELQPRPSPHRAQPAAAVYLHDVIPPSSLSRAALKEAPRFKIGADRDRRHGLGHKLRLMHPLESLS